MQEFRKIVISGNVQGVGFRPFVARTAGKLGISGFVRNEKTGVVIKAASIAENLDKFIHEIHNNSLPGCKINSLKIYQISPAVFTGFRIAESRSLESRRSFSVINDTGFCQECYGEFSQRRRSGYVFNSCVSCGPRFTILNELPFDRKNTSMESFPLCPDCLREYSGELDRRFHAQTISCAACGPRLYLFKNSFNRFEKIEIEDPVKFIGAQILNGSVIAVKSTGGFHLVCDAANGKSVAQIRQLKNRPHKPFAVMFGDIREIEKRFILTGKRLSDQEKKLLTDSSRPVVLVNDHGHLGLSEEVSKGRKKTGIFLPDSLLYKSLLDFLARPVVATSLNITGEPLITDEDHILTALSTGTKHIDFILSHDRKIVHRLDDSVINVSKNRKIVMRKARGLSPFVQTLPGTLNQSVLAMGANEKSTIAMAMDNQAWLGPHLGNIDSLAYEKAFEESCESFLTLNGFKPDVIVSDFHPGYFSVRHARYLSEKLGAGIKQVYHHHAHANSLMIENNISPGGCLFTAVWDGTGLGPDNTIWGGEFLENRYDSFDRKLNLKPFRLLSGDLSVREPWRVAVSLLFQLYGENAPSYCPWVWENFTEDPLTLFQIWNNPKFYTLCSSAGRLFDGAASLLNLRHYNSYEAQAAMDLEDAYDENETGFIDLDIDDKTIDYNELMTALIDLPAEKGASLFINSMAALLVKTGKIFGHLGLTGGVFQNAALLDKTEELATNEKVRLYLHNHIPCNDGGIALGQIATIIKI